MQCTYSTTLIRSAMACSPWTTARSWPIPPASRDSERQASVRGSSEAAWRGIRSRSRDHCIANARCFLRYTTPPLSCTSNLQLLLSTHISSITTTNKYRSNSISLSNFPIPPHSAISKSLQSCSACLPLLIRSFPPLLPSSTFPTKCAIPL